MSKRHAHCRYLIIFYFLLFFLLFFIPAFLLLLLRTTIVELIFSYEVNGGPIAKKWKVIDGYKNVNLKWHIVVEPP
jgi:hypothetical protein